jgi:hypothetical protein
MFVAINRFGVVLLSIMKGHIDIDPRASCLNIDWQ